MPVLCSIPIPRLNQKQFGGISFRVMEHVFAIHRDFGRLFDERIYKRELARRLPGLRLETQVDVTHGTFAKRYFLDVLTAEGAIFEFKAAESFTPRHRAQLLNYLLLLDLAHGKLVNLRPGEVQHEFVNAATTTTDRRRFAIHRHDFDVQTPGAVALEAILIPLLEDLGTGLDLGFYEEAVAHLLGGEAHVERAVEVIGGDGTTLGMQRLRLCAPEAAFRLTTFATPPSIFADHCQRLLRHLPLEAVQWINIANHVITLTTVRRTRERFETKEHEKDQSTHSKRESQSSHFSVLNVPVVPSSALNILPTSMTAHDRRAMAAE